MEIVPNLHFNGCCEEALKLYEEAFGAQRTIFLRYKDANPLDMSPPLDDDIQEYVYHTEIRVGKQRLMLTDHTDNIQSGINVSLLVSFDRLDELIKAYDVLKTRAKILVPMTETTYSAGFVSLVDPFGVRWELIKEN